MGKNGKIIWKTEGIKGHKRILDNVEKLGGKRGTDEGGKVKIVRFTWMYFTLYLWKVNFLIISPPPLSESLRNSKKNERIKTLDVSPKSK